MSDSLIGPREPRFRYLTVNRDGVPTGDVSESTLGAGRLDFSQQATIRRSGDMERSVVNAASSTPIVKIEYVLDLPNGTSESWPLGVFHTSSPTTNFAPTGPYSSLELYDGTLIPHQDALDRPLHLPAGSNVLDAVRAQLLASGVPAGLLALTPSNKTLRSATTWKPGTTRLRVINDLLAAADYFSLYCDRNGTYVARPYVTPAERPVMWTFREEPGAAFTHDIVLDEDTYSVPNKVVGTTQLDGAEEMLYAVAAITDPDNPFHVDNLGRWRVEVMEGVQLAIPGQPVSESATDEEKAAAAAQRRADAQAALQKKVDRRLLEAGSVGRTIKVNHGWLPVDINDVVLWDYAGIKGRFVVTNQTIPLKPTALVTTTLKEASDELPSE